MPELFRMSLPRLLSPRQRSTYVLTSRYRIHISNPYPSPLAKEIDAFNDEIQQAAADPAPAFLDEVPRQGPVPNGRGTEVLRQLAILYLNDPSSRLDMLSMEPGHDGDVTVVIALKLTDL